jgi:hypothetical protein
VCEAGLNGGADTAGLECPAPVPRQRACIGLAAPADAGRWPVNVRRGGPHGAATMHDATSRRLRQSSHASFVFLPGLQNRAGTRHSSAAAKTSASVGETKTRRNTAASTLAIRVQRGAASHSRMGFGRRR